MKKAIDIDGFKIGENERTFIIAENVCKSSSRF